MTDEYTTNQIRILRAATQRLSSSQIQWMKGLTLDDLASDTGIDKAEISRAFGEKAAMVEALIDFALSAIEFETERSSSNPAEVPTSQASSSVDQFTMVNFDQLSARVAIWAMQRGSPKTMRRLAQHYERVDSKLQRSHQALCEAVRSVGFIPIAGLSVEEFVAISAAVVDGLAIRQHSLSTDELELPRKAITLLMEGAFDRSGEEFELGQRLASIDSAIEHRALS